MKKIHNWKVCKDTGKYQYLECEKCDDRAVKIISQDGYQPIDNNWTNGKRPSISCIF